MSKLFFSNVDNTQNDALSKITIYLLGELSEVLLGISSLNIREVNILDLIESIIFKVNIANDTVAYGLSALLKLHDKFIGERERILKMIKSFENHNDL
jgi:hypothetical protein